MYNILLCNNILQNPHILPSKSIATHYNSEQKSVKAQMTIDFKLEKDIIPEGKLHSEFAILSWDKKQEMQKRVCLYCDSWGTFAIQPKGAYRQYYFLCGDHYSNEKNDK